LTGWSTPELGAGEGARRRSRPHAGQDERHAGPLIDRYEKELWKEKRWGANKAYELTVLKRDLGAKAA
jgi:hypothetical protein